jgi:hypothetical protein
VAAEGFEGMAALISGLARMDDRVKAQAHTLVRDTAQLFAADLPSRYPSRTGNLRAGVRTKRVSDLRFKVSSRAPHAHLFEYGTGVRSTASTGANRGRMEGKPTFIPRATSARARMVNSLIQMLVRQTVPGMTGHMDVQAR